MASPGSGSASALAFASASMASVPAEAFASPSPSPSSDPTFEEDMKAIQAQYETLYLAPNASLQHVQNDKVSPLKEDIDEGQKEGPSDATNGYIRSSMLAFPTGDDVYDHSPDAPFALRVKELISAPPPRERHALNRDVSEEAIASLKSPTVRPAGFPKVAKEPTNTCYLGFGGGGGLTWSCVCCDATTRAFLRAHPLFQSPLCIEPHVSKLAFRVADDGTAHGKGLIATRNIARGDVIVREPPLLVLQIRMTVAFVATLDRLIDYAMHSSARPAFDELFDCWPANDVGRSIGIARTNMLGIRLPSCEEPFGGTFQLISRVNHSCEPNATWDWDYKTFQCTLTATRNIKPGDEITFSYISLRNRTKMQRREELQRMYRFRCTCTRCGP